MKRITLCLLVLLVAASSFATAQNREQRDYTQLAPNPYVQGVDPDIDLYIGSWKDSEPRTLHGNLVVRDILTHWDGDPMKPVKKGQVLTELKSVSRADLAPGVSTTKSRLSNEQYLMYCIGGSGTITYGKTTDVLGYGSGIAIPPGIDFTITNDGTASLAFYFVVEPIVEGRDVGKEIVVSQEFEQAQFITVHWAHIDRPVFGREKRINGQVVGGFTTVKIDPMTMSQPHSHGVGVEEVWFAVYGDIDALIGKQMRKLPAGSAYKIPPNGQTPHANINVTDSQVKLVHMMKSTRTESYDYSQLDGRSFNPDTDCDIDLFTSDWRGEMPHASLGGSMVERDMFRPTTGDPMSPVRTGDCLTMLKGVSHGSLEAGASTAPTTLDGEQMIMYVTAGMGIISSGGKTEQLENGVGVLMPPGVEFTMANTGAEPMALYIVREPIAQGFTPRKDMLVKNTNPQPYDETPGHWTYWGKSLFGKADGLAVLSGIAPITLNPRTFAQPHSHAANVEELWITISGDPILLLGKQLRRLHDGIGYKVPPNGTTPHANNNMSSDPIQMLWLGAFPE